MLSSKTPDSCCTLASIVRWQPPARIYISQCYTISGAPGVPAMTYTENVSTSGEIISSDWLSATHYNDSIGRMKDSDSAYNEIIGLGGCAASSNIFHYSHCPQLLSSLYCLSMHMQLLAFLETGFKQSTILVSVVTFIHSAAHAYCQGSDFCFINVALAKVLTLIQCP